MTTPLRKQVRDHYTKQNLSDGQFEKLSEMISSSNSAITNSPTSPEYQASRQTRSTKFYYLGGGIASTLLLTLAIVLSPFYSQRVGVQQIAIEVANNHSHLKPLTIQSDSYERNKAFFSQLSFDIAKSSLVDNQRFRLLGGRYCSLNGLKAAQLRVKDTSNNTIQTLYQVENSTQYFRDVPKTVDNGLPVTINVDGVPVTIWSENGIIFSLTHSPVHNKNY